MDRKTLTIVLSVALIASFFLAYFGSASGLDIVKTPSYGWEKYLLLLIPIAGLLLLLGALNKGNNWGLLSWLPLLAILFWIIAMPLINGVAIGDVFKMIGKGYGVGMWIAIVSSLILAFYNPRK